MTDVAGFSAALDALMTSDAGKASAASVYLSKIAAAGIAPVTHLISVGYQSEAEAEESSATVQATKAWERYVDASRDAASNSGAYMMRTLETWGDAAE